MDDAPRYFSNWGPLDGPISGLKIPFAMGVYDRTDGGFTIGRASPIGESGDGAGLYRLRIREVAIEGRWRCVGRAFVREG